jgi:hypothetical protein
MNDDICLVCHLGPDERELFLLPCNQCNNERIENKKYIHKDCLQESLDWNQENEKVRCPYCSTHSIALISYIEWLSTIQNFIRYLPNLLWVVSYLVVIILSFIKKIPSNLSIDSTSFRILRLTISLVFITQLRKVVDEIPYLFMVACQNLRVVFGYKLPTLKKFH